MFEEGGVYCTDILLLNNMNVVYGLFLNMNLSEGVLFDLEQCFLHHKVKTQYLQI